MCLLPKVLIIEFSKPTLLKEYHSGIRGGKRSWTESEQKDKWQQQLLKPGERKQPGWWCHYPSPWQRVSGSSIKTSSVRDSHQTIRADSIRHWSNQEWRSKALHLDEQGVQTWLGMGTSRLSTSSWRRGAWVEPGTSSVWGNCVTESHPQWAFFLSADAERIREHTQRGCALSEGYVRNPSPAPGSHPSHEDGDILCHGQWTVWTFTLLTSRQGSRRKSWVRNAIAWCSFAAGSMRFTLVGAESLWSWFVDRCCEKRKAKAAGGRKSWFWLPFPGYSAPRQGSRDNRTLKQLVTRHLHHQEAETVEKHMHWLSCPSLQLRSSPGSQPENKATCTGQV